MEFRLVYKGRLPAKGRGGGASRNAEKQNGNPGRILQEGFSYQMAGSSVKFGPMSSKLFSPLPWTDDYPDSQEWADELETLLEFCDSQGKLARFLPKLTIPRNKQRDATLSELRVALFLHRSGFPIAAWEPPGNNGKEGEYSVRTPEEGIVFTEVKSRGWESELTQEELDSGRTKLPKYLDNDRASFANWKGMRDCISAAYSKFTPSEPNLLVIADNFFVSLARKADWQIDVALFATHDRYGEEPGYFATAAYQNLGAVAVFAAEVSDFPVEYRFQIFQNPFALVETAIPPSLASLRA